MMNKQIKEKVKRMRLFRQMEKARPFSNKKLRNLAQIPTLWLKLTRRISSTRKNQVKMMMVSYRYQIKS